MSIIRLLLVDDHALVRAGLRALLGQLPGVEVVAEASDGREALHLTSSLQPDIVLMDISMAGLNGLEATARLTRACPQVRVIILSMHAVEEYVVQSLHAGAAGYLLKNATILELELAIKAVARGEMYLSPPLSKMVIADYLGRLKNDPQPDSPPPLRHLTSRQREVLQLIAEGYTTKDIARCLDLSVKTVETHRAQLMRRLDVHDVAGLVRYAIRTKLVFPDS